MILFRIALRNLLLHKFKTAVVGVILLLGTTLVVLGNGVLDAVDKSMAVSLVNSVTGHVQIYSAGAEEEFQIFGSFDGSMNDIGRMKDFPRIRRVLEALPEVDTVVPMGIDSAVVFTGNVLDRKLSELRTLTNEKAPLEQRLILLRHIRRIVAKLDSELVNLKKIADMSRVQKESGEALEAIAETRKDAFWARFETTPFKVLEDLENKVAKLAPGEDLLFLRYIGTDTERFEQTFDRFEIVDGTRIPPGQRGFLFNKRIYERFVKNKTAYRLDRMKERLDDGIEWEECEDCESWVKLNVGQAASLSYRFDEKSETEVVSLLQKALDSDEPKVVPLLETLLDMGGGNFQARYALFYEIVAPRILLYSIGIGDSLTLTAYARGGSPRKHPVKVYGTFRFKSLDRSPLAGGFNLMDLMSFRDLYGFMTEERLAEINALREKYKVKDITADRAEAELFGAGSVESVGEAGAFNETEGLDMKAGGERYNEEVHRRVYSREEIESGIVLNAAVMLQQDVTEQEGRLAIALAAMAEELPIVWSGWREVAGLVGQFIGVIRAVLYAAVFIIFIVALVIINNSMMMSTMERTREIGTMRAIGAQRSFVRRMILIETGVLTLIFGGAGAALGAGGMLYFQSAGIGAWNDVTYFLFAGPRLYPELMTSHLVIAIGVIAFVGIGSTLYPAVLATSITPRAAMAKDDG